jgi:benzylsuccinate CoA-transferase BbsE subunit
MAIVSSPLSGVQVLDLTGELGGQGSRRLACLGAGITLLEPPGGHPMRRRPPLVEAPDGRHHSLWFAYLYAGARSVCLDPHMAEGRVLLGRLASGFDVVSFAGAAEEFDALRLDALQKERPRCVVCAVTPFGLSGPRRNWRSGDLVAWAAGGAASLIGDADRAPLVPRGELALIAGSQFAAIGILAALRTARREGRGQLIDISLQEVTASLTAETGAPTFLDDLIPRTRMGSHRLSGGPFGHFPTLDGHVHVGAAQPAQWDALARWIHEETGITEVLDEGLRGNLSARFHSHELVDFFTAELTSRYTKQEAFLEGQRRGVTLAPVNEVSSLAVDPDLEARGFWGVIDAGGRKIRAPRPGGRVHEIGEHTAETLATVGVGAGELRALSSSGVV